MYTCTYSVFTFTSWALKLKFKLKKKNNKFKSTENEMRNTSLLLYCVWLCDSVVVAVLIFFFFVLLIFYIKILSQLLNYQAIQTQLKTEKKKEQEQERYKIFTYSLSRSYSCTRTRLFTLSLMYCCIANEIYFELYARGIIIVLFHFVSFLHQHNTRIFWVVLN